MRPKVVIITLVAAFVLLGAIAIFKGVAAKHAVDSNSPGAGQTGGQDTASAATNAPVATGNPNTGSAPVVSEQLRQALIDKEAEQIRALLGEADGTNNSIIIAALLEKMASPEAEVRRDVVQAFRELNDTNAVPGLLKAVDNIKDAREKVFVLDAVEYIKAPDIMAGYNLADYTNNTPVGTNFGTIEMNPRFNRGAKKTHLSGNNGGQGQPADAPATQPQ
jgi:hypothetical protein